MTLSNVSRIWSPCWDQHRYRVLFFLIIYTRHLQGTKGLSEFPFTCRKFLETSHANICLYFHRCVPNLTQPSSYSHWSIYRYYCQVVLCRILLSAINNGLATNNIYVRTQYVRSSGATDDRWQGTVAWPTPGNKSLLNLGWAIKHCLYTSRNGNIKTYTTWVVRFILPLFSWLGVGCWLWLAIGWLILLYKSWLDGFMGVQCYEN